MTSRSGVLARGTATATATAAALFGFACWAAVAQASIVELTDGGKTLRFTGEPGERNDARLQVTDNARTADADIHDPPLDGEYFEIHDSGGDQLQLRAGPGCWIRPEPPGDWGPRERAYCPMDGVTTLEAFLGDGDGDSFSSLSALKVPTGLRLPPLRAYLDGGTGDGDHVMNVPGPTTFVDPSGFHDSVSYFDGFDQDPRGVTVTLDGVANDGESGESDNVGFGIDDVEGTRGDDVLVGNDLANSLGGAAGRDRYYGLDGPDRLGNGGKYSYTDDLDGDDSTPTGEPAGGDYFDAGPGEDYVFAAQNYDHYTDTVSTIECGPGLYDQVNIQSADEYADDCEFIGNVQTHQYFNNYGDPPDAEMDSTARAEPESGDGKLGMDCRGNDLGYCEGTLILSRRVAGSSKRLGTPARRSSHRERRKQRHKRWKRVARTSYRVDDGRRERVALDLSRRLIRQAKRRGPRRLKATIRYDNGRHTIARDGRIVKLKVPRR